ncbi:MHYT domain-containing protein [Thalassolituus sp. LLYu03]|uniref:MHYT domain-containing protein n=1 Tax=Thalassolituus sp. LLYu03 TaxID=3421656 RepID=UPI003D2BF7F6
MHGHYDLTLVTVSYLVAILASYCALYFGAQLTGVLGGKRARWLGLGAFSMGLGIWSMHFIGMGAYQMHAPMSYDLEMTVISAVAAVLASALALHLISQQAVSVVKLVLGSLAMGGGVAAMHYLGMAAMRMTPSVSYDPLWFSVSIVIAVVASGAALAICRYSQTLVGRRAVAFQGVAALVMGAAICGMHYTGMAAVEFPSGAVSDPANELSGGVISGAVVVAALCFIVISMLTVYTDVKARLLEEERLAREEAWVQSKAFTDAATGLPNRAGLERYLLDSVVGGPSKARPFSVVMLEVANFRDIGTQNESSALMHELARQLKEHMPHDSYLGRYSNSTFGVVVHQDHDHTLAHMTDVLAERLRHMGRDIRWKIGHSRFPLTGHSSRMLILEALRTEPT